MSIDDGLHPYMIRNVYLNALKNDQFYPVFALEWFEFIFYYVACLNKYELK